MSVSDLYARFGDTDEEVEAKCDAAYTIYYKGCPQWIIKAEDKPWQFYYRWDYDEGRVHQYETSIGYGYARYAKKKRSAAERNVVRLEYYRSGQWIATRNRLLFSMNFVCASCGGIATEAHHQAWDSKWQNYVHLGDHEKESSTLVPLCHNCHGIVTRMQNKKMWKTTHSRLDNV